jgi:histidine triad (HIT) family protein
MPDCIFCKIIAGEIPSTLLADTEHVIAIRDIAPKAPSHLLIIPKRHIPTMNDVEAQDHETMGAIITTIQQLAQREGIDKSGYRVIINTNTDGGQEVYHLHWHLLGGRPIGPMVAEEPLC